MSNCYSPQRRVVFMTPTKTQVSSLQSKSFVSNCVAKELHNVIPKKLFCCLIRDTRGKIKWFGVNKVTIKSGVSLG